MTKQELENKLIVGAKVKIGARYSKNSRFNSGEVITLIEGFFYYDNGLYDEAVNSPSVWDEQSKDYDSIYHLFGNDLENFADCEILTPNMELRGGESRPA